jgi:transcriptional regulator with XRE-family HTH domain
MRGGKPDPVDIHVGQRVRQARMEADVSQTALGDILGLTFQQVQKYEKGTNRIAMSRILVISKYFKKPVSWFFDGLTVGDEKMPAGKNTMQEFAGHKHGFQLAQAFMRLNKEEQRFLVELAEQFHGSKKR